MLRLFPSTFSTFHAVCFNLYLGIEINNSHAHFTDEASEIKKGKATCSTSQLKSHTGSPGPQPEVLSMSPLPCMGSAVSLWFGALGRGGAELIGVNGIDVFGLETVSPLFTCPLPPFEPLLHLKEKHKSKQRGTKQRFMNEERE